MPKESRIDTLPQGAHTDRRSPTSELAMDISHLAVLHNSRAELPALLRAALGQADDYTHEVLLVDNGSTDGSGQWLAEQMQTEPRLRVLHFAEYAPHGLRLNQAVEAAQGLWLHLMNPPSLPPANLCAVLIPLLTQHFADGAQGIYKPTEGEAASIESHPNLVVWDRPLEGMLTGAAPQTLLCRRELFLRAGGADVRGPWPDTRLSLRLAFHAQRWLRVKVPLSIGSRRNPSARERTDAYAESFVSYSTALQEFLNLTKAQRRGLYHRAMSNAWKQQRHTGLSRRSLRLFWFYMLSTWPGTRPNLKMLAEAAQLFPSKERPHVPMV